MSKRQELNAARILLLLVTPQADMLLTRVAQLVRMLWIPLNLRQHSDRRLSHLGYYLMDIVDRIHQFLVRRRDRGSLAIGPQAASVNLTGCPYFTAQKLPTGAQPAVAVPRLVTDFLNFVVDEVLENALRGFQNVVIKWAAGGNL
ncbi:unnamed protein product [Echinostoma caproni]|uniref:Uncharacterized protein n=1 Tax=Echinostoma caproni TaxID=27848 RepID=A0A183A1L8_9TREM|nr:unnamed protein product [Echinostoma caproni]